MLRCLICDDEPPARELIASYISKLPELELVGSCDNALDAFSLLQKEEVDLLFLDIQMPRMTGMELIRSLQDLPRIVLISAYKEYAAEAYDLDVLDYLVKPVTFERFMKSIARYHRSAPRQAGEPRPGREYDEAYLYLKVDREQVRVYFKDILYVEGLKDYIRVWTTDQSYVSFNRLSYMEEVLPESRFARIHKSYIVSLASLESIGREHVRIGGKELPVGRVFKLGFQEALSRYEATRGR